MRVGCAADEWACEQSPRHPRPACLTQQLLLLLPPPLPLCRDKLRGLPLAPGCVSVYIRHGDKGSEHKTFDDAEYEAALEYLRSVDPTLTRQVFLSTEDPQTVAYFTNATRNWATSYVDMPRKPNRCGCLCVPICAKDKTALCRPPSGCVVQAPRAAAATQPPCCFVLCVCRALMTDCLTD
jgi:hypothetical protein